MKRQIVALAGILIALAAPLQVRAAEQMGDIVTPQIASEQLKPMENYNYFWKLISKTSMGTSYEAWRIGPTGTGPGTLSVNESRSVNRSYTNSISGSYSWGKASIGAAIGVSIGEAETHGTSYSISLGKGETKTIIIRPRVKKYKVITGYYRAPVNVWGNTQLIRKETSYVTVFDGWEYGWRKGR